VRTDRLLTTRCVQRFSSGSTPLQSWLVNTGGTATAPRCIRGRRLSDRAIPLPAESTWRRCRAPVPTRSCAAPGHRCRARDSAARPSPAPAPALAWESAGTGSLCAGACACSAVPCPALLPAGEQSGHGVGESSPFGRPGVHPQSASQGAAAGCSIIPVTAKHRSNGPAAWVSVLYPLREFLVSPSYRATAARASTHAL
jgi:hypothetical protein